MATLRRAHWLLIRVAAQNVGRRRFRAILLGAAVMLGVGIGFASFVAGWALRTGIATSLARMGADLVVVPRETLVNITSSLLTVQPTDLSLDGGMAMSLAAIPGIARVAPQRIVSSVIGGDKANLVAFDPSTDFSILPWLGAHQPGPPSTDSVIAGGRIEARVGDVAHAARILRESGATPGQTKVGIQLVRGKTKPMIADELGIQLFSVADLTQRLYQTLDVHNSTELATKIWLEVSRVSVERFKVGRGRAKAMRTRF